MILNFSLKDKIAQSRFLIREIDAEFLVVELAECNVTNSMQTFSVSDDYLLRVDDFCLVKSEV